MIGFKKTTILLGLFVVVSLLAVTASAGILDTEKAYSDDLMPSGWQGNTPFVGDDNPNLAGSIDWAVFAPGVFGAAFPDAVFPVGYSLPTDQFTYVYQVHCLPGRVPISLFAVALQNEASHISTFTASGVNGDGTSDTPTIYNPPEGSAVWNFAGILTDSCGLLFSSRMTPMDYYSVIVDEGTVANGIEVSSPSPTSIPEPATIWLLSSGLGLVLVLRRCRRR